MALKLDACYVSDNQRYVWAFSGNMYIYNEKSLQDFGSSKLQTTLTCLCTNLSVSSRDRETIKFMAFNIIFLSS